jgi:hypothetical protein
MSILTLVFVISTAWAVLVFWLVWQLVRLLDLSLVARRTAFVLIGTIILAPMIVPAATIMVGLVPHGLLILTMPSELLDYYFRIASHVFSSFFATGLILSAIALRWIRLDTARLYPKWINLWVLLMFIILIVPTYRFINSTGVHQNLSIGSIEATYGPQLDDVTALLSITDAREKELEIKRLNDLFKTDISVIEVRMREQKNNSADIAFYYLNGERGNIGCVSSMLPEQKGLQRCKWTAVDMVDGLFFPRCKKWFGIFESCEERDVLQYVRPFKYQEEERFVRVAFDYKEALKSVSL